MTQNYDGDSSNRNIDRKKFLQTKQMKKEDLAKIELDWDFFNILNKILEYTNVVLNDLEIFSAPEIYSSILRNYYHVLPQKVIDCLLNTIYKITVDKNHRISIKRYNGMFSKDLIKTFSNIFCLYCLNVTSKDEHTQSKYFNLLMKLIYHNILIVNEKTLWSNNLSDDPAGQKDEESKDNTSFFQMNRGNGIVKDKTSN